MTKQTDVLDNPNYTPMLNAGFVGLIDSMGDDSSIVRAARVSYGDGTKSVSEDRGLIRYLVRHLHTTPLEMVEFQFHCKMPIFVARQWIRHRTANVNEYSGRYSVMVNEFYVPELEHILPQSKTNNQGRGGEMSLEDKQVVRDNIIAANENCYERYQELLGNPDIEHGWSDDFEGLSREMARGVLSVNNYTEWYWKCDLHNIFHFLGLRMDEHAQYEIRVFANAMYKLIKPIIPLAAEAFEDYRLYSERMSRMEMDILKKLFKDFQSKAELNILIEDSSELSSREKRELREKLGIE